LDFPGGCELKPRQLITCANLGKKKCLELCDILEKTLEEADTKAVQERLDRLKLASGKILGGNENVQLPDVAENVPFVERTDYERDGDMMEVEVDMDGSNYDAEMKKAAAIAAAEEESYRIQALDYSLGHVAAKVKENNSSRGGPKKGPIFGGSLMAAMLQSAGDRETKTDEIDEGDPRDLEIKTKKCKTSSSALSSRRTQEADEEFARLAQEGSSNSDKKQITAASRIAATNSMAMALDSDEEEETTMLQSEFGTMETSSTPPQQPAPKPTKTKTRVVQDDDDDDDVDDLAMAVKKKSKKSKKKKSKK